MSVDAERSCHGLRAFISAADWDNLGTSGVQRVFRPGDQLCRQDDSGDHVFVLLSGAVKVVRSEAKGRLVTWWSVHGGSSWGAGDLGGSPEVDLSV
ncbi:cyclic nucleotide-binding domain-containing protein, partial [Micromonospora profundi]|uniref:cyclic nucleotide-binding domain-containing protein n=1 Tax=Micromonospora profundi TaxID=1420889 RepID=UPI0033B33BD2